MKAVILAGGFGSRIGEETIVKPKPMIQIGGMPIMWHIMKIFSNFGINEFVICAGYKQNVIKDYFANYALYNSDMSFDLANQRSTVLRNNVSENWKVTVIDTGLNTMTGGRIKRIKDYIGNEPFFMTYGDGVSDVDIDGLLQFHKKTQAIVTMTVVQPEGRFGIIDFGDNDSVKAFREKDKKDSGWINGGFMVMEPKIFDYINGDSTVLEQDPLRNLAKDGGLNAYRHSGFWQCMDTLRDKEKLEALWATGKAPWKVW
jgi:glucose-1-phosphate cytidylyltransferase